MIVSLILLLVFLSLYTSPSKSGGTLFQVPKNDPRNRSHSIHSTDDLDERRKEEADFKKIVTDMFKELETERKDQRKKMNDLERYILELKAESSELLEVIKELRYRLVIITLVIYYYYYYYY